MGLSYHALKMLHLFGVVVFLGNRRMARAFAASAEIPERYWRYGRLWAAFGILATLLPLFNLYWMVFKR